MRLPIQWCSDRYHSCVLSCTQQTDICGHLYFMVKDRDVPKLASLFSFNMFLATHVSFQWPTHETFAFHVMRAQASKDVLHHEDLKRWGGHMYVHLVGNLTKCVLQLEALRKRLHRWTRDTRKRCASVFAPLNKHFCNPEQANTSDARHTWFRESVEKTLGSFWNHIMKHCKVSYALHNRMWFHRVPPIVQWEHCKMWKTYTANWL